MEFRIKEIRQKQNLSQQEIADLLGIPVRRYGSYEREERTLSLSHAIRIADILDCSLDEIAGRKWSKPNVSENHEFSALASYYESMSPDVRRKLVDVAELMSAGVKARIEKEVPEDHPDQTAMGA